MRFALVFHLLGAVIMISLTCSPPPGNVETDGDGDADGDGDGDGDIDADADGDGDGDGDGDTDADGDSTSHCDPGIEFPAPEDCNNIDDDCDGEIDEDIRPRGPCTTTCGAGEEQCENHEWVCVVTDPVHEECNGVDDNCNGLIDEDLVRSTGSEFDCMHEVCVDGTWVAEGEGIRDEVCNGVDDDCDGEIDEGTGGAPCFNACGIGMRRCVDGALVCNVAIPLPEVCDNRDNDCDGTIDEGVDRECPCGMGVEVCEAGTWVGDCLLCVPGAMRWCDEPSYCSWGQQVCDDDGHWGTCYEVDSGPPGCDSTLYDTACCVEAGECCQDFAHGSYASVGDCEDECVE